MLALDNSGSMDERDFAPSRLAGAKRAANGFLDAVFRMNPRHRVGIVTFNSCAELVSRPLEVGKGGPELRCELEGICAGSLTNMEAGLDLARDYTEPKGRIVLLTDGAPTSGDAEGASMRVKEAGIELAIIGIGGTKDAVDEDLLRRMASVVRGQTRYWFISDSDQLLKQFQKLGLQAF
jgi:Mg-chelatase subunit ChlD